jgi:uncharacterized membrane protein
MGTVFSVFLVVSVIAIVVLVAVVMVGRRAAVHRSDISTYPDEELEERRRRLPEA